jgi:hypothetical protein
MYCHLLPSVHAWRKTTCAGKYKGYFDFTPLTICAHLDMCYNFVLIVCCRYFYTCEHLRIQKLPSRRRRRTWFVESFLSLQNRLLLPQHHYHALNAPKTYQMLLSTPANLTTLVTRRWNTTENRAEEGYLQEEIERAGLNNEYRI